jgi:hypothetical protein
MLYDDRCWLIVDPIERRCEVPSREADSIKARVRCKVTRPSKEMGAKYSASFQYLRKLKKLWGICNVSNGAQGEEQLSIPLYGGEASTRTVIVDCLVTVGGIESYHNGSGSTNKY